MGGKNSRELLADRLHLTPDLDDVIVERGKTIQQILTMAKPLVSWNTMF